MPEPDAETTIPKSKAQKYLEDIGRAEGAAARAVAQVAGWMVAHPHLALATVLAEALIWAYLGYLVGRP